MRTILLPVAADPTVTILFSFRAGSQDDPPGREGLAALTAKLLSRGATERLAYETILERLYPLATSYDAIVDKELATIGGRVHRDKLDEFVELLLDAMLRPAFSADDFERLKSDAINFIGSTLRYASDEDLGKAALTATAFAGTRYAHPVEGTIAGLNAITLDDVRAFYASHYVGARLTTGIGGGYSDALVARLEQALGELPAGQAAPPPAIEPRAIAGRSVMLVDKPGADCSISFGHPLGVARGERDFYALMLASSWLGEHRHPASHLYQVIREARGLNYGDYSYIEAFPQGGLLQMPPANVPRRRQLFEVWIRTLPNDQAIFTLKAALRELDRFIEQGFTPEQFELTRQFVRKYSTHFAPTTAARVGYAIDDGFYGLEGDGHLARLGTVLEELSLDDVNTAIRRHWQTERLFIAIVTGDADGLARTLASDAPTPIEYANPMPAKILDEDKIIAAWPLEIGSLERRPVGEVFAR